MKRRAVSLSVAVSLGLSILTGIWLLSASANTMLSAANLSLPASSGNALASPSSANNSPTVEVSITDSGFNPSVITVTVGTTVAWINAGERIYTVASDVCLWHSGDLASGQVYTYTFEVGGDYLYHCSRHPEMSGKIVVTQPLWARGATLTRTVEDLQQLFLPIVMKAYTALPSSPEAALAAHVEELQRSGYPIARYDILSQKQLRTQYDVIAALLDFFNGYESLVRPTSPNPPSFYQAWMVEAIDQIPLGDSYSFEVQYHLTSYATGVGRTKGVSLFMIKEPSQPLNARILIGSADRSGYEVLADSFAIIPEAVFVTPITDSQVRLAGHGSHYLPDLIIDVYWDWWIFGKHKGNRLLYRSRLDYDIPPAISQSSDRLSEFSVHTTAKQLQRAWWAPYVRPFQILGQEGAMPDSRGNPQELPWRSYTRVAHAPDNPLNVSEWDYYSAGSVMVDDHAPEPSEIFSYNFSYNIANFEIGISIEPVERGSLVNISVCPYETIISVDHWPQIDPVSGSLRSVYYDGGVFTFQANVRENNSLNGEWGELWVDIPVWWGFSWFFLFSGVEWGFYGRYNMPLDTYWRADYLHYPNVIAPTDPVTITVGHTTTLPISIANESQVAAIENVRITVDNITPIVIIPVPEPIAFIPPGGLQPKELQVESASVGRVVPRINVEYEFEGIRSIYIPPPIYVNGPEIIVISGETLKINRQ